MNRRDLEDWVTANHHRLSARGVRVLFGFATGGGRGVGPSWISFISRVGSGRLIRAIDGSSRVDAYAFADGAHLREEREDETSVAQLDSLAELLTVGAVVA